MAIVDNEELAKIRQAVAEILGSVDYNKPVINAAIQAIEDWYESDRLVVSALIDTATDPVVLTNPQKKKIGAYWLTTKFLRELV